MKLEHCGDSGITKVFHCNLPKDSPVVDVLGCIDELQSALDIARLHSSHKVILDSIQEKLRFVAGEIAGYVDNPEQLVSFKDSAELDSIIEEMSSIVPGNFVRFTKQSSAFMNEARVRARALERKLVSLGSLRKETLKYINRLSDLLFVVACNEDR